MGNPVGMNSDHGDRLFAVDRPEDGVDPGPGQAHSSELDRRRLDEIAILCSTGKVRVNTVFVSAFLDGDQPSAAIGLRAENTENRTCTLVQDLEDAGRVGGFILFALLFRTTGEDAGENPVTGCGGG